MTKHEVYNILQGRFPSNEYALMQEVSNEAGHARSRSADFIAVSLWPSRGCAITGIEQKASRSDWLVELKTPQKAESIFKYCDFFYLLTTKEGIAKIDEIPLSWGWMEIRKGRIKILKEAPKQTPQDCTRSFIAAMLKRASNRQGFIHESQIEARVDEMVEQRVNPIQSKLDYEQKKRAEDNAIIERFEQHAGINLLYRWKDPLKAAAAIKLYMENGVEKYEQQLLELAEKAEMISQSIKTSLQAITRKEEPTPQKLKKQQDGTEQ